MKKVDFVFVYEVRPRELENICLIAAELETRGYTTGFVNTSYSLQHPEEKSKYACKVLVVSTGNERTVIKYCAEHVVSFNYIINLQWEQVIINLYANTTLKTPWDFDETANKISHICWGIKNKKRLMNKFNLNENRLCVSGYPTLDFYRQEFKSFFN